jgi:N-acetylmuramoyl-L-alanine amidase
MRIKSHKVEGLTFQKARYIGEEITPELVILHDTAGRLEKGNSADYLASANAAKASVHFVIELDGTIVQQVPTNRRANHAGASSFHGRSGCNAFSIGIELVNPGKLTRTNGGSAISWWGQEFGYGAFKLAEMTTKEHGAGVWMPHSEAQIEALISLLEVLFRDLRTLKDISTHWYVSPGRKVDPNPLLPLEQIRARVLGTDDPADAIAAAASLPAPIKDTMVQIEAGGDSLNLRRWPSFNPNILATIPDGAIVPLLREGTFGGRAWSCVLYGGQEGWIVSSYAAPIAFSQA